MLDQMFAHLLAVFRRVFKDADHGVLVEIEDPGASTNTIAFGECFEDAIDRLFVGMETGKDAIVSRTKSLGAF